MDYKKIPLINDSFDPNSLVTILKQNRLLYIVILLISFAGAFIFYRYSEPLFETWSIIQVSSGQNEIGSSLFKREEIGSESTNLNFLVELLRSPEFQKRILRKLPLSINYYSQGTFLNYEQYTNNPYFCELKDVKNYFYEIPVYVKFKNEHTYEITYTVNSVKQSHILKTNRWYDINGCKIYLNVSNYSRIKEYQEFIGDKSYYFIAHTEQSAIQTNLYGIQIGIANEQAGTIKVDSWGYNPEKITDIANALCADFTAYSIEKQQEQENQILIFIEEELKLVYEKLDESEKDLSDFKKKNNIDDDVITLGGSISSYSDAGEEKLKNLRKEIGLLIEVKKQLSSGETNPNITSQLVTNNTPESMISNYLNAIHQLQVERDNMLINVTENNQKIKMIDKQIANQKQLLNDYINIANEKLLNESKAMENRKVPKGDSTSTTKRKNIYNEIELAKLMRIYRINEGFFYQLVDMKAKYMISKAGHVSQNIVLQKADVPSNPVYPVKSRVYAIFIALGVFIMLGVTTIKYLLHNEITTLSDITQYTDVPISGVIPMTKRATKTNKRLLVENKADSIFTEAFRTFRSNIEFLSTKKTSKVIATSSTVSGEGKTFIALNLGGVLSFSGRKTIIIDMDLRRPKIHLNFESENDKGMSTILIGRDAVNDCIRHTELQNFDFISSGPIPPNPSELAASKLFETVLDELRLTYDYILIDTPPIGIVSDAISSFQLADIAIYITRVNVSRKNFIYNLNYLKDNKNIQHMSLILNGVEIRSSRYGYNYNKNYYAYGYSYGNSYGYTYGYYGSAKDLDTKPKGFFKQTLSILNIFKYFGSSEKV